MWAVLGLVLAAGEILTPGRLLRRSSSAWPRSWWPCWRVGGAGRRALVPDPALLGLLRGVAAAVPQPAAALDGAPHAEDRRGGQLRRRTRRRLVGHPAGRRRPGAAARKRVERAERSASGDRGRRPLPRDADGRPRDLD
ncbi:MAG: hypothetical protein MZW92_24955 [Comamonadaceae bacterium]|nr:hypothetical protein [Comamonadaceae bacterium]